MVCGSIQVGGSVEFNVTWAVKLRFWEIDESATLSLCLSSYINIKLSLSLTPSVYLSFFLYVYQSVIQ